MRKQILSFLVFFSSAFIIPLAAFGQLAVANGFEASPVSLNSGEFVTLTWRTSQSSGANIIFPCAAGVKYRDTSDVAIECDKKLQFGVTDSKLVKIVNASGSSVILTFVLNPLNSDGTENTAEQKKTSVTVATQKDPISEFSASPTTVVSSAPVVFSWKASDVDKLNIKMTCSSDITPRVVGDDRPRVPCEQMIFGQDLAGSGTKSFTLESSSLEPVKLVFTLLPKISLTGSYDGTHAKSIEITVLAASQVKSPVVTSYQVDPATLRPGEYGSVSWNVLYGAGVNFQLKCPAGVTATTSRTGASLIKCGSNIFGSIQDPVGAMTIGLQNALKSPQYVDFVLLPAIGSTEYDSVRARTAKLVVLGNEAGVSSIATTSVTTPSPVSPPAATAASSAAGSPPPVRIVFLKTLSFGLRKNPDVTKLQELLKADGVYDGPVTGNFFGLTREAVKRFQKKYGFEQVGVVGPLTRKKLNEIAGK